jgi:hypothetical protein
MLVVTACGIVTSVLIALLLALLESRFGIAVYSFAFVFLPVGAVAAGLAAASGYYLGGRLFQRRPTRVLLFNIAIVAILTYFLVNYFNYSFLESQGRPVSSSIPFGQYMDFVLRHQTLEFRSAGSTAATGELGAWGYLMAALEVLAFSAGSLLAYAHLSSAPYCQACRRYLPQQPSTRRFTGDGRQFQAVHSMLLAQPRRGDIPGGGTLPLRVRLAEGPSQREEPEHGVEAVEVRNLPAGVCRTKGQEGNAGPSDRVPLKTLPGRLGAAFRSPRPPVFAAQLRGIHELSRKQSAVMTGGASLHGLPRQAEACGHGMGHRPQALSVAAWFLQAS